ncbi:MAG: hypothetical protein FWE54_04500 [Methanimicrococcus sp.]|nr:hypothetical protein [Methanimicrococcus sp.]
MKKANEFMKNLAIVIVALYFYFSTLFIVGYILTWVTVSISVSLLGLPLTDILMLTSAAIIFTIVATVDLYLAGKKKWSPAMVIMSIPLIIVKFIESIIRKTVFTIDTSQTPMEYIELNNSFKNILRPIRDSLTIR